MRGADQVRICTAGDGEAVANTQRSGCPSVRTTARVVSPRWTPRREPTRRLTISGCRGVTSTIAAGRECRYQRAHPSTTIAASSHHRRRLLRATRGGSLLDVLVPTPQRYGRPRARTRGQTPNVRRDSYVALPFGHSPRTSAG